MGIAEKLAVAEKPRRDAATWHVFDIETGYADQDTVNLKIAEFDFKQFDEKEFAPGNTKDPEKLTVKAAEFAEKEEIRKAAFIQAENERFEKFRRDAKLKSSLADASPITCLSFETGNADSDKAVFSCMPRVADGESLIDGFQLFQFPSEAEMLEAYADYVQSEYATSDGFVIAGHNILGFDLPKIRNRMIRNGLQIPPVFLPYAPRVSVYDTMRRAADFGCDLNKRGRENGGFISFDMLANSLGMDSHKSIMTGAEIPANHEKAALLLEDGKTEEANALILDILIYSALDAQKETKAFRLMTGRY